MAGVVGVVNWADIWSDQGAASLVGELAEGDFLPFFLERT